MNKTFDEFRKVFYATDEMREIFAGMKGDLGAFRKIPLIGDINEAYIGQVILELIRMDYEDDSPITLLMCSPGGDTDACYDLIDLFSTLNSPIHIFAFGENSSGAVDLLQAAKRRVLFPNSRLLLHYARHRRVWIGDDPSQVEGDMEIFKEQLEFARKKRFALYKKSTGLSINELKKLFRYGEMHDAFVSARQAIRFNLADEIVTDFKLFPDKTYERKK